MPDARYEHALAAMALILELVGTDAPKYRIASQIQFILLHMLESYDAENQAHASFSEN